MAKSNKSALKGGMVSKGTKASFNAVARKLRRAAKDLEQVFPHGLYLIGEEIITDVKDARPGKGVPVDEGTLRDTGRALLMPGRGVHAMVELSFGGAATTYALIQHENLQYRHTIGEARYLIRGMERWSPNTSGAWAAMQQQVQAKLNKQGRRKEPGE